MRVLVVEDERDLAEALVRGPSRQGLAVDLAADGARALEKTWGGDYDVILLAAGGAIVSAERLLEQGWDENPDPCTNTVRVTVSTLRQKLGPLPVIETVIGSGYVIR